MKSTISGIVLAGGKSQRYIKDKKFEIYQNKTFIQIALKLMSKFSTDITLSLNKLSDCSKINFPIKIKLAIDKNKNKGPLEGLNQALKLITYPKAIIIPVDTPLLTEKTIQTLINQCSNNYEICIAECNEKLQPLIGIFSKSILTLISKNLQANNLKILNLIRQTKHKVIHFSNCNEFLNINTQSDYKKLLQMHLNNSAPD